MTHVYVVWGSIENQISAGPDVFGTYDAAKDHVRRMWNPFFNGYTLDCRGDNEYYTHKTMNKAIYVVKKEIE